MKNSKKWSDKVPAKPRPTNDSCHALDGVSIIDVLKYVFGIDRKK